LIVRRRPPEAFRVLQHDAAQGQWSIAEGTPKIRPCRLARDVLSRDGPRDTPLAPCASRGSALQRRFGSTAAQRLDRAPDPRAARASAVDRGHSIPRGTVARINHSQCRPIDVAADTPDSSRPGRAAISRGRARLPRQDEGRREPRMASACALQGTSLQGRIHGVPSSCPGSLVRPRNPERVASFSGVERRRAERYGPSATGRPCAIHAGMSPSRYDRRV